MLALFIVSVLVTLKVTVHDVMVSVENDIDLDGVLRNKLRVNEEKYPKEIAFGSNKKYNEW